MISLVLVTTYSVLVDGSMTGVPVMPITGTMSFIKVSAAGTGVIPAEELMKLRTQSG